MLTHVLEYDDVRGHNGVALEWISAHDTVDDNRTHWLHPLMPAVIWFALPRPLFWAEEDNLTPNPDKKED